MEVTNIMNVRSDFLSQIFSFIIFDAEDFNGFSKLLMAWFTNRTTNRVKDVLERLDWDSLYQFHNHYLETTRDQFHGFISFAVRHKVEQAMFYNSVQKLFSNENVQHHSDVLASLSGNHFPSLFCSIFFKAINRTFHRSETVKEMFELLNKTHMRRKWLELISLLEEMYSFLYEKDHLLPIYKFCPNARNKDPMYQIEGHPLGNELWYSLCNRTVEEKYSNEGEVFGKGLTMAHMWKTDCAYCKVQLILFKILLSAVRD